MKARHIQRILRQISIRRNSRGGICDFDAPRQISRRAIEFLIEIIAPASNRLAQSKTRCDNICPLEEADSSIFTTIQIQRNQSADNCAWDSQSTFPNLDNIERVGQVIVSC